MVFDRLVEGGAVHLSADGAAHVCDLFRALADERDHDPHVGMVDGDAVGDLLKYGGLAGLGGRDYQSALSSAGGGEQVYEACGEVSRGGFELEPVEWEDGREALELGAVAGGVGLDAVDLLDSDESEVSLAVFWRTYLSDEVVAGAQSESADLGLRDVDVA